MKDERGRICSMHEQMRYAYEVTIEKYAERVYLEDLGADEGLG